LQQNGNCDSSSHSSNLIYIVSNDLVPNEQFQVPIISNDQNPNKVPINFNVNDQIPNENYQIPVNFNVDVPQFQIIEYNKELIDTNKTQILMKRRWNATKKYNSRLREALDNLKNVLHINHKITTSDLLCNGMFKFYISHLRVLGMMILIYY